MITAKLEFIKKNRKNPCQTWHLEASTSVLATIKAQDTITRTLRTAEKEAEAGDKTRLNNLRGATLRVTITKANGTQVAQWEYKPTVR